MSRKKQVEIQVYKGYSYNKLVYAYGRVLVKEKLLHSHARPFWTLWANLLNSFKRLESDELPEQPIQLLHRGQMLKQLKTNSEGFFRIHEQLKIDQLNDLMLHIPAVELPAQYLQHDLHSSLVITENSGHAKLGIISDIDDTILKTDVLSRFKLKLLYNSLFVSAARRKIMGRSNDWYRSLQQGVNPFFYISNSPWNFYNYLSEILQRNQFPDGPILLRDFGMRKQDSLQRMDTHKADEIKQILHCFDHLPFLLIGDSGERDAAIYLDLYRQYPTQIKAILIRKIAKNTKLDALQKLATESGAPLFVFEQESQAIRICKELGLL